MVDSGWHSVSNVAMDEDVNLHGRTPAQATTASTPTFVRTDSHADAHTFQYVKLTSGQVGNDTSAIMCSDSHISPPEIHTHLPTHLPRVTLKLHVCVKCALALLLGTSQCLLPISQALACSCLTANEIRAPQGIVLSAERECAK